MSILDDVRSVTLALAAYTGQVLMGDLWKRTDMTPRDRSLVTVTALIAANQMELLPASLDRALDDGVTLPHTEVLRIDFHCGSSWVLR